MNAYNVAVTVGPNIFRRVKELENDFHNHGAMYDALITMILNYSQLFEETDQNEPFARASNDLV